jgi:hypothetical protein
LHVQCFSASEFFTSIEWTSGRVAAMPSALGSCNQTTIEDTLNNTLFWGQSESHSAFETGRTSAEV